MASDHGPVCHRVFLTIASLNAVQLSPGMAAYCSAKAGVAMLTKVAAMELGARGIRVNAIAPGLVDQFVANTTLGRFAHADERAGLAA